MKVKRRSLISIIAIYGTLCFTLPYEWRVGIFGGLFSTSIAIILVLIVYLFCQVRSKMMLALVLYNSILLLSCAMNSVPMNEQITLSLMGIALAASFELVNKYADKNYFTIYVAYFVILVIINSLQLLYYGTSRDASGYLCIFGNKNWYLYKILPANYLTIFWCARFGKPAVSLKLSVLWILSIVSVMVAGSGAGTLVLGIWALYIIVIPVTKRIKQNESFDNYIVYTFIIIAIFFIIVVWNAANIFAPIIVDILGKDLTFTTRTRIWARALELIAQKPVIGYGALSSDSIVDLFYAIPDFTTTHNQYLGELFRGGVTLLVNFIFMLILAFRNLRLSNKKDVSKIFTFGLFCLLLWWMMESITSMYLILVLFICYHLPENTGYISIQRS